MRLASIFMAVLATALAMPAAADDRLGTIARGNYICELPGDASGSAGFEQSSENFTIKSASRYSTPEGGGTYLLRGNELVMTNGPRQGDRYVRLSDQFLRKKDADGNPTRLRCVRSTH